MLSLSVVVIGSPYAYLPFLLLVLFKLLFAIVSCLFLVFACLFISFVLMLVLVCVCVVCQSLFLSDSLCYFWCLPVFFLLIVVSVSRFILFDGVCRCSCLFSCGCRLHLCFFLFCLYAVFFVQVVVGCCVVFFVVLCCCVLFCCLFV